MVYKNLLSSGNTYDKKAKTSEVVHAAAEGYEASVTAAKRREKKLLAKYLGVTATFSAIIFLESPECEVFGKERNI